MSGSRAAAIALRVAVCALAGHALAQADTWFGLAELAWLAIAVLSACLLTSTRLELLLSSLASGMAFWYSLLGWATFVDGRPDLGLSIAGAVIALLESSFLVIWALAVARTQALPLFLAAPLLGLLWALEEMVRTVGMWAMPYGEVGASQSSTALGGAFQLVGTSGVSVLLVASAYTLARLAVDARRTRSRATLLAAGGLGGALLLACAPHDPVSELQPHGVASIAVVRFDRLQRRDVPRALAFVGRALNGVPVDLVMLPEGALKFSPDPSDVAGFERWAAALHASIEVGAELAHGTRWTNSTLLFSADDTPLEYDKQKLVPFGEFVPAAAIFEPIVVLPHRGFEPGNETAVWHLAHITVAPLICFEIGFGDLARRAVAAGADAIIVPQNDDWYSAPGGTSLQSAVSLARARSLGLDVVLASPRGRPTVFHGDGSISFAASASAVSTVQIAPKRVTPYARFGDLPLAAVASFFASLYAARAIRAKRPLAISR